MNINAYVINIANKTTYNSHCRNVNIFFLYCPDRKVQKVYGSLPFDLEACHQIIPKMLPCDYPSELSKLIEKEIANSITIMEDNSCSQGLVNKEPKHDITH